MQETSLAAALGPLVSRVRTDITAIKVDGGSRWTREALTAERLAQHVAGGTPRGVCPIKEGESTTRVALLDLDSHGGESSWSEMAAVAVQIMETAELFGLAFTPWRSSGGRGIHLYALWDEPQDAYSVRMLLVDVLEACGLRNGAGGVKCGEVEVFPKQDRVPVGGFGNQFILPLAGRSVPLEPLVGLEPMDREHALGLAWPVSDPVPVRVRPVREVVAVEAGGDLFSLKRLLDAIPNSGDTELDYDEWRDVVFAIHHETSGSDAGLALAHEFSARSGKFDPDFLDNRVWPYIDSGREGAITIGTIRRMAARHGWAETVDASEFPDLTPAATGGAAEPEPLPAFERDKKGGIEATMGNTVLALRRPDLCGMRIAYDEFRDEITVAQPGTEGWRPMADADMVRVRIALERLGFKAAPKELARDAAVLVSVENTYDSAQLWLGGLVWDGKPRVETFLIDCMGCEDTPYTRAVARYMWSALAGRVLQPGVKADMVPIYEGDQGLRKSSAIEALSPSVEFFVEIDLAEKEENTVRKLRGSLVGEIAELSGLHTRALEDIKKFVVRKHEKWVPKYKEFTTTFARRLLFVGTTNRTDILADETGNRRWLPLHITRTDTARIERERAQLWAEGAAMFRAAGVHWQDAERLAPMEHGAYQVEDAWQEAVSAWLNGVDEFQDLDGDKPAGQRGEGWFTTAQVLVGALGLSNREIDRLAQKRVCAVLRGLGYVQKLPYIDGVRVRAWRRADLCASAVGTDLV